MTKTKEVENKKQFGLLSMIAMVMGIVIGSGIFAKNAGLISTNGSIYITFSAWVVGALLVLAIVVAFMELFSMTEKANEQSTYANWGRMLVNSKFAKIAGIYFIFVNLPFSIVALTFFAGNRITDVAFVDTGVVNTTTQYFLTRLGIVILLLAYFFTVNGFYTKPGKIFQNTGTAVKVIPLALVFVLFIVGLGIGGYNDSLNPIFNKDFNDALQSTSKIDNKGFSGLIVFAATMPAIIFVFDGFLTSGSLSKEAKTPTTYKVAVLSGIIMVIFIYLSYSLGVFALGAPFQDANGNDITWTEYKNMDTSSLSLNNNYGEINNAIMNQLGIQWLASTITIIVAVSILTSVSGVIMSAMRGVADMSSNNLISDKNGRTMKRTKDDGLPGAMQVVLALSIIYGITMVSLDAIAIPSSGWSTPDYYHTTASADFFSNLTSVGSFIIMTILIGAAVRNRKTNKVDSLKYKTFIPAAFIAIITMVLIVILYVLQLFWFSPPSLTDFTGDNAEDLYNQAYSEYVRIYIIQIVSSFIWLILTPVIYLITNYMLKNTTQKELESKQIKIDLYKNN